MSEKNSNFVLCFVWNNMAYKKEELKQLKTDFWNGFAEYCNTIPRLAQRKQKFMLYNTRLKGTELKFDVQRHEVSVVLEINHTDYERRIELFEHFKACRLLFEEAFDGLVVVYEPFYKLETGKEVCRIYVVSSKVAGASYCPSVLGERVQEAEGGNLLDFHRRDDWQQFYQFMARNMMRLERIFNQAKQALE